MSEQMQRDQVIEQLMRMLDSISLNARYLRYFQNENALVDPKIYFDICQIIFSEFSIKLIKIQQYQGYDDGQKLDQLIKLITEQLGIYMPELSGKQIIKFNISHIYEFLNLLLEYSKLYFERGSGAIQPSIKTQPNQITGEYQRDDDRQRNPFSARSPGIVEYSPKSSQEQVSDDGIKPLKQSKNGNTTHKNVNQHQKQGNGFSKHKNRSCSKKRISQNMRPSSAQPQKRKKSQLLYNSLVKVVIDQKNRANKSSLRDQRKNRNEDIQQARKKYHQYLKSYSKQKKADTQRNSVLKKLSSSTHAKSNPRQLPLDGFQNTQNFFKSFNHKLRDMKDVYIRRMKKQIHHKEQQKMLYRNRLERQNKLLVEKMISRQVQCLNNEHHLRKSEIKETVGQLSQQITLVQKEMKRKSSQRKRQLKEAKKMDLDNLKNIIRQQNQRILMELEKGGRMQRVILGAYGKF